MPTMPTDGNLDGASPNGAMLIQSSAQSTAPFGALADMGLPPPVASESGQANGGGLMSQQLNTLMPFIVHLMQQAKALSGELQSSQNQVRQYEHLYRVMVDKMREQKAEIRRLGREKEELRKRMIKRDEEYH